MLGSQVPAGDRGRVGDAWRDGHPAVCRHAECSEWELQGDPLSMVRPGLFWNNLQPDHVAFLL